jgi:hypothetical protein
MVRAFCLLMPLTSSYPVKPVLGRSIDGWSGVGRFIV